MLEGHTTSVLPIKILGTPSCTWTQNLAFPNPYTCKHDASNRADEKAPITIRVLNVPELNQVSEMCLFGDTDLVCNMYIVDPSITVEGGPLTPQQELLRNGVEVMMFSMDAAVFPKLRKAGDLIRFHRVEVRSSDLDCSATLYDLQRLPANNWSGSAFNCVEIQ